MVLLIRSQPEQNIRRFYVVSLAPTLFGEWTVMREWGRIGQPGQLRSQTFTDHAEAAVAQQRSIKT